MTETTGFCSRCFDFTVHRLCPICSDPSRDPRVVMVVEQSADVSSMERTVPFNGLYHVLHGSISPVNGIGPGELYIDELVSRLDIEPIAEIILATRNNMEGIATAMFIQKNALAGKTVKITRLLISR